MAVTITEAAAKQIQTTIDKRGGIGFRLAVQTSGCSGFKYVLDYADETKEGDTIVEAFGAKLLVGPESLPFIEGTEVGYEAEGLNYHFVFNNPKAINTCGCGESFNIEE